MAGLYIHIPFCRQKCRYCDFYKTTDLSLVSNFLHALEKETERRKDYLNGELIETIYFGGGTPSVLKIDELNNILDFLYKNFSFSIKQEITLEANPDDLDTKYIKELHRSGINRLSIGIQAFQNEHLIRMHRRHTVSQAIDSVINATKSGFNNISVDLIYGLPYLSSQQWISGLDLVFRLPVDHLSAYHITYHKGTTFFSMLNEGILKELPEKESLKQFYLLTENADKAGFEHYEISNFAKNGKYSKHNMSYWTGKKYLGLGPSAHSYNGFSRCWNVASTKRYLKAIENNSLLFSEETLTEKDRYNEFVLTNLRTKWGISASKIKELFSAEIEEYFKKETEKYILLKKILHKDEVYFLSREGLFISDDIIAGLMII